MMAGFIVQQAGYDAAFLVLAAIAAIALLVLWKAVPESKPPRSGPQLLRLV